ncbi:uncharacterized protein BCR38DRAFT_192318 [Pseudomassariella vexata]|uniref:PLD phosphodiesterase domain-containing protein n=1 Tax=Pseudomassariella vexata TaxID=1141098 RepID=A0A1Y2E1E5_9PEZI|nr:uncharacterized protein BCR38DRAFT_192318 [Pseudomassariella vexata]ORY65156.1 hypothetical protein BCR38DRAFT_192318 [Pseudomassariella vexata]
MSSLQNLGSALYQALVEFPSSALTIPRQQDLKSTQMPRSHPLEASKYSIGDSLYNECRSSKSVSALVAEDVTVSPGDAWKKGFGHYVKGDNDHAGIRDIGKGLVDDAALLRARDCGKWGKRDPSELFLRLYHDALSTLDEKLALGMVSPSLMGSSGVVPLTVISVIPDIVRHMSNMIVRAEREVFLATNFWQNGVASAYITDAMRELSRRAGERGSRIVMKILYDRGSPRQLLEPHYIVSEKEYTGKAVGIPAKHEIPNIDLEVMNYHNPMLGTSHAKYMIVDRKMGVIQSNNIQDNDNMEMMVQIEGPIVDSMYDMALLSWHKKSDPPFPSARFPAAEGGIGHFPINRGDLFNPNGTLKGHSVVIHPNKLVERAAAYGPEADQKLADNIKPERHIKFAGSDSSVPAQTVRSSQDSNQQVPQQPKVPAIVDLPEHTTDNTHYDKDIAGEIARVQESVSTKPGETRMQAVTRHLNHTTNMGFLGNAPDCEPEDEMTPMIPHPVHDPFPIALVNRPPYGPPNHKSVSNPQNAVWLSALRNAKKNVFIQSPTLNAEPLVPAIVEACERGIDVYCYICLGYNDAGELLPMQGGHNEMVSSHLYAALSPSARPRLHYFWYVAKDQTKPIVADKKRRSCHIKLMIVDEYIGIIGSGNQDTQSWFHSQESNIMLESREVCKVWIDALRRNQNTHRYGMASQEDGVWRSPEGNEAEGAIGADPGKFSWARGVVGAVKRLQGTGGF